MTYRLGGGRSILLSYGCVCNGARGRNRTGMTKGREILSLLCLPVPPLGRVYKWLPEQDSNLRQGG